MIRQFEVMGLQQVNQHLLCSICREVFYNPIRATCGHTFCGTCLVRWIQQKKSCPLCRHQLERNYKFDKDILATKIVGDVQVKCLRCLLWNGTLAAFKQHKKTQCKFVQKNNEIPQNAIEIGDDNAEDITFPFIIIDTRKIVKTANHPILVQIDEQNNKHDDDLFISQTRQSNHFQNDNSQVEISPYVISDQSNHIIIETQDNVVLEESSQQQQIFICPNNQLYIDIDKLDNQNQNNQTDAKDLQITINEQDNHCEQSENRIKISQNQQIQHPNQSEIEILEPSLRILNSREIKELKSKRKFKINTIKNAVSVVEPLIDSMNDDQFNKFIDHMKKEMTNKLNELLNTSIL
ncbi:unnamed protein product [Paramecium octaurelia]|uniref:RING-type domain-containing protein n=1 Tax=Paramecium octaurelia TaxID=43137 RepID=A0A8S1UCZ3_PAROT|nr:unnamed protein product [Paramecium octaurelia]